ncbi:hypothetical protein PD885_01212 [Xanthomonas fragariae]|uniref:Uncharacterized protein n=1 Tax=Xanthomonas fragariae TaxID=48664 RepID=A0ABY1RMF1_9XANT|nr:hypothetical protein PD885_01212 [Xanthomonas fragariae]
MENRDWGFVRADCAEIGRRPAFANPNPVYSNIRLSLAYSRAWLRVIRLRLIRSCKC